MCSTDLEYPEFWSASEPVARKRHLCAECRAPIPVGEKHVYKAGKWDGEFRAYRSHAACEELRDFIEEVVCGGHGDIPLGALIDEAMEAGEYLDQDRAAWDAADLDLPNPLISVVNEIRVHYGAEPLDAS
jgi:hypothetical protein